MWQMVWVAISGQGYREFRAFSKHGFHPHGAAVKFGVVFDDGQAQTGAFFLGGEVGLKNAADLSGGMPGPSSATAISTA